MEQMSYDAAAVELVDTGAALGTEETDDAQPGDGRAVAGRARFTRLQRGMVSAEWAVGIIAAIALAGVLLGVVTTGEVHKALLHVILTVINKFSHYTG